MAPRSSMPIVTTTIIVVFLSPILSLHPLDSLTPTELNTIQSIIHCSNLNSSTSLKFHYVGLDEPTKHQLLSWLHANSQGCAINASSLPRRAFVIAMSNKVIHELYIDLQSQTIISDSVYDGFGYPIFTLEEQFLAVDVSLNYPPFIESVEKRGQRMEDVVCTTMSFGWFGEVEQGKRLINIPCYVAGEKTINYYLRPLEGITILVDLDDMKVAQYSDRYVVAVPKAEGTDFRKEGTQMRRRPTRMMALPEANGFDVDGNVVRWRNWAFHLSFDARAGLIISSASFFDSNLGTRRQVLYRGYVSEIFVPYMDPSEEWYYRTFFDVGEFGTGQTTAPLEPETDCPSNAMFFDGYYANEDGIPVQVHNAYCVFERYAGNSYWRHTDFGFVGKVITEVEPETTLVVRTVASFANYDYIFDWEFKATGSINMEVSMTGIVEVKATDYTHVNDITTNVQGTLLTENTVGIYHDHYITYYMDIDIDGPDNTFVRAKRRLVTATDGSSPRKSYWTVVSEVANTEKDGQVKLGEDAEELLFVNTNKRTKVGNEVAYRIVGHGGTSTSMLWEDDYPEIRASFLKKQVWVTRYNKTEKWASGLFVDQSRGDGNLEAWTKRNRKINDEDIMLWYSVGFHHVPCQEDFPIMARLTGGFELRPFNFFDSNPLLFSDMPTKLVHLPNCTEIL